MAIKNIFCFLVLLGLTTDVFAKSGVENVKVKSTPDISEISSGNIYRDCECWATVDVTISCEDNSWAADVDFNYSAKPIPSAEDGDNAICRGSVTFDEKDYNSEAICKANCENYCASQFAGDTVSGPKSLRGENSLSRSSLMTRQLEDCVQYFRTKCETKATIEGAFEPNEFSTKGWWEGKNYCNQHNVGPTEGAP